MLAVSQAVHARINQSTRARGRDHFKAALPASVMLSITQVEGLEVRERGQRLHTSIRDVGALTQVQMQ